MYVVVVAIGALLLTPLVLRYSRALMLYWFGEAKYVPRFKARPGANAAA